MVAVVGAADCASGNRTVGRRAVLGATVLVAVAVAGTEADEETVVDATVGVEVKGRGVETVGARKAAKRPADRGAFTGVFSVEEKAEPDAASVAAVTKAEEVEDEAGAEVAAGALMPVVVSAAAAIASRSAAAGTADLSTLTVEFDCAGRTGVAETGTVAWVFGRAGVLGAAVFVATAVEGALVAVEGRGAGVRVLLLGNKADPPVNTFATAM